MSYSLKAQLKTLLNLCQMPRDKREANQIRSVTQVLKLDTQFLGRRENKDVDLNKVVQALDYRFVPKHGTAMRAQEIGTEFVILLEGMASGWVAVPAPAVLDSLEKFFKKL
jgi:hypothetical protein